MDSSTLTADDSVSVEQLRAGLTLPDSIYDEDGVLLLAAGSEVTTRFLALLMSRGITFVRIGSGSDAAGRRRKRRSASWAKEDRPDATETEQPFDNESFEKRTAEQTRLLEERLPSELDKPVAFRPVTGWRRPRLPLESLKLEASRGLQKHEEASLAVGQLCKGLAVGRRVPTDELRRSVARFVEMSAVDFDLLPLIVAMQRSNDEYLYDHSVSVAMLSMAIAAQLGLNTATLTDVGLGGMLHDIGMLRVSERIRTAPRALTDEEWQEVRRHPFHTLDMLSGMRDIPQSVKYICYQVHETMDGTGYPCNLPGSRILPLSRIVAVADAYTSMTAERPYREAMGPYAAMVALLNAGKENRYDRELVRALLDTVSLFPIGSCVELNSGENARVLRANPARHTSPVVELLDVAAHPTGRIVDLSRSETLKVVNAA